MAICLLDYLFLGRELPSAWSALCIGAMILGGAGYALTDSAFVLSGYAWLAGWMLAFLFDQIYIKHVVESVPVASNWSRAMYTNAWAALFLATIVCASPEERLVFSDAERWTGPASLAVGASCGVAVFISYLSFLARKQLSATAFTVLGEARARVRRRPRPPPSDARRAARHASRRPSLLASAQATRARS